MDVPRSAPCQSGIPRSELYPVVARACHFPQARFCLLTTTGVNSYIENMQERLRTEKKVATSLKIKRVPALKARAHLGELMKEVQGGKMRVLVERSGVPMVGIISAEEFQRVVAEREARFEVIDRIRSRLPAVPDTEVDKDVRKALKDVRQRRRA